uniref:WGR domain-containing protein n=1 Tax=Rickettsia endosymbiont of Ixodes pacificus TaxID=1133329 RepID=UPI00349EBAF9
MPYYWTKDHKYYRLNTQDNLFGTTDLVCSWGSLYSNKGNYKVIHCTSQHEIDMNIKRITRIRASRGYTLRHTNKSSQGFC